MLRLFGMLQYESDIFKERLRFTIQLGSASVEQFFAAARAPASACFRHRHWEAGEGCCVESTLFNKALDGCGEVVLILILLY